MRQGSCVYFHVFVREYLLGVTSLLRLGIARGRGEGTGGR